MYKIYKNKGFVGEVEFNPEGFEFSTSNRKLESFLSDIKKSGILDIDLGSNYDEENNLSDDIEVIYINKENRKELLDRLRKNGFVIKGKQK